MHWQEPCKACQWRIAGLTTTGKEADNGRFIRGTPEGRAKVIAEEPVGRMRMPEEIAAAVLWLCSNDAAFMIGHAMVIAGGQTMQ